MFIIDDENDSLQSDILKYPNTTLSTWLSLFVKSKIIACSKVKVWKY